MFARRKCELEVKTEEKKIFKNFLCSEIPLLFHASVKRLEIHNSPYVSTSAKT
jgi:hypothetical protein